MFSLRTKQCLLLIQCALTSSGSEELVVGQRRGGGGLMSKHNRLELLQSTISSFDMSMFPPCFLDSDCVNGYGDTGRCIRAGSYNGYSTAAMPVADDEDLEGQKRHKKAARQQALLELQSDGKAQVLETYLKRYLWTLFRSTITREKVGKCERSQPDIAGPLPGPSASTGINKTLVEHVEPATDVWEIIEEPLEFDLPSILKKFAPMNEQRLSLEDVRMSTNIGNLGEIQCSPMTKIAYYDSRGVATHGNVKRGVPINGAFLIRYSPLMSLPNSGQEIANSRLIRYVSEPYEYLIAENKLRSMSRSSVPHIILLQRREMKGILGALSEMAGVGQMHGNKHDPVIVLYQYLNPQSLASLQGSFLKLLKSEDALFLSLREITHSVELSNGVLTLVCDNPGEGIATVEITYFLPSIPLLQGISALLYQGGILDKDSMAMAPMMTVGDFIQAVQKSSVDQTTCHARVLCIE